MRPEREYASAEEMRYATLMKIGVQAAFVLLVATFALYLAGVLEPLVPIRELPKYWSLSAAEFARATHAPTGWRWLAELDRGDVANFAGMALLASISALGALAVAPMFVRRGELGQAAIAVLLFAVVAIAAVLAGAP